MCEVLGFLAGGLGVQLGNRALLILGVMLFAPVIVALAGTWLQIRGTEVLARRPGRARVGEKSPVELEVRAKAAISTLLLRDPSKPRFGVSVRVDGLRSDEQRRVTGYEHFPRRGLHHLGPIAASTARPLGLARTERLHDTGGKILVLPALGRVRGRLLMRIGAGRPSRRPTPRRGDGSEVRHLRPYVPGDSCRAIHWPTSARAGSLVVREWEQEEEGTLVLLVGLPASGSPRARILIEATISLAATIMARAHGAVVLVLPKERPLVVRVDDRAAKERADELLALADPSGWPDLSEVNRREPVRVVLLSPGHEPPPRLEGVITVIDVSRALDRSDFMPRGNAA